MDAGLEKRYDGINHGSVHHGQVLGCRGGDELFPQRRVADGHHDGRGQVLDPGPGQEQGRDVLVRRQGRGVALVNLEHRRQPGRPQGPRAHRPHRDR